MDDSFSARFRSGQKSSLLDRLDADAGKGVPEPAAGPEAAGFGDASPLPQAGDSYVAHSRPSNGAEATLFCIDRDGLFEGYAWHTYERISLKKPERPGGGPILVIRFHGSEIAEVVIEGQNLDALRVFLGQRRVTWIRELGEDKVFGLAANDAVITRLSIRTV